MTDPEAHPQVQVDARGLRCPVPVIRLAEALARHPEGTEVRLLATDPAARTDVPAFCRMRAAHLVSVTEEPDHVCYTVRLRSTGPAAGPVGPDAAGRGSPGG